MSLAISRRFLQAALPLASLICLTACGGGGTETKNSYEDLSEYDAKQVLGPEFTTPIYDKSTLFEVKKTVSPGETTTVASFHTNGTCPEVCDNYSRLLRIHTWVVPDIEKSDSASSFKATRNKEKCSVSISNSGGQTVMVITVVEPK